MWLSLSTVSETATSDVVIMSIGVRYCSKISNTLRRKPYAISMRAEWMRMTVMPSLAATAWNDFVSSSRFDIVVPGASGSIVFLSSTAIP